MGPGEGNLPDTPQRSSTDRFPPTRVQPQLERYHGVDVADIDHNIKPGVQYPATLISTADMDDRAVPMHSFKFAATLGTTRESIRPVGIVAGRRDGPVALHPQQSALHRFATWSRVPADPSCTANHAMARNDQRHRVSRHHLPYGSGCTGGTCALGQLSVGQCRAVSDLTTGRQDLALEVGPFGQIQTSLAKVHRVSGCVCPQQLPQCRWPRSRRKRRFRPPIQRLPGRLAGGVAKGQSSHTSGCPLDPEPVQIGWEKITENHRPPIHHPIPLQPSHGRHLHARAEAPPPL